MTKEKKIETLIDRLRGTTESMTAVCEDLDLDDTDSEVCAAVDQEIFCCTLCGWWCPQDEESSEEAGLDEWTCWDCVDGVLT